MALKRQPVHAESAEILACKSDTQGEKKTTKSLTTPLVTETRGQGSAQTSGCLPASVREKFIFQQQRAFSEPVVSQMRRSRKFLLLFVKQARQNNEVGTYSRKSSAQTGASAIHSSEKAADNVRVPISTKTDSKALAGQTKSPLSSGTSSSPTSPLVTTPSSKLQPHSNKAPGSPPPQKSFSGGNTLKSSSIHGGSKVSSSGTSGSKQVASLTTSKSVPTPSPSPLSSKAVNTAKASSRSSIQLTCVKVE
ncbi:hypothetical protein MPTK1_7g05990 [Marchantia polymorpha subsp. ruderalis]|uniref:Uncharacterized protein n=2 Tax=Marchantia polymorpha TaxID=3197 RepID=A0AAF6BWM1_MARPO|nr:hypothetical protein MARPO_0057s0072 [Marchantia polymorpha]BBN16405.1 hypothetical protein Mp_7g05990 [Marchantia polymorpha subsp. ruderalis]|eukprot:PTQ37437.1 hypothetical protein MARPO_0057s0072 [Marchantia polymorpha]